MKEGEFQGGLPKNPNLQESPEERLLQSIFIAEIVSGLLDPNEREVLETYDKKMQSKAESLGRELTSGEIDEILDSIDGAKDALDRWTGLFEYYSHAPTNRYKI